MKTNSICCLQDFDLIFSGKFESAQHLNNDNDYSLDKAIETNFSRCLGTFNNSLFDDEERNNQHTNSGIYDLAVNLITKLVWEAQFIELLKLLDQSFSSILFNFPIIKLSITKLHAFQLATINNIFEADMARNIHKSMLKEHNIYSSKREKYLKTLIENSDIIFKSSYYNETKLKECKQSLVNIINYAFSSLGYSLNNYMSIYSLEKLKDDINSLLSIEKDLMYLFAKYKENGNIRVDFDDFVANFVSNQPHISSWKAGATACINSYYDNANSTLISLELDFFGMMKDNIDQTYNNNDQPKRKLFNVKKNSISNDKSDSPNLRKSSETDHSPQKTKRNKIKFECYKLDNAYSKQFAGLEEDLTLDTLNENPYQSNQNLSSKHFSFEGVKRKDIDKLVIKKFKKYMSCLAKNEKSKIIFSPKLKLFISNSLNPPFTYLNYTFKSFSSRYMSWILSDNEIESFYNDYLEMDIENLMAYLDTAYHFKNQMEKLREYLIKIPLLYREHQSSLDLKAMEKNYSDFSKYESFPSSSSSSNRKDSSDSGILCEDILNSKIEAIGKFLD